MYQSTPGIMFIQNKEAEYIATGNKQKAYIQAGFELDRNAPERRSGSFS